MSRNESPEARIAVVVRELIVREVEPFPNVPDFADIRDAIRPYLQREILRAQIDTAMLFGTFPHVLGLQKQLDSVNFEIAKREMPDAHK
jgi:hypothetical protein